MELSTSTTRLPLSFSRLALCFSFTPEMADAVGRLDEGAPDIVIADDAELERDAPMPRHNPSAAGTPESGTGTTMSASAGASRASSAPMLLAHLVDVAALDHGIGPREIDIFEDAEARAAWAGRDAALDARPW